MKSQENTKSISRDLKTIYKKTKLYNYHRIFRKIHNDDDEDSLTALDVLCLDLLQGLGSPSLTEFARYINISKPNATYRINTLEEKGFVKKIQSEEDGRIYFLEVTEKTKELLGTGERYIDLITRRLIRKFSKEELAIYDKIMATIADEFMIEMDRYLKID